MSPCLAPVYWTAHQIIQQSQRSATVTTHYIIQQYMAHNSTLEAITTTIKILRSSSQIARVSWNQAHEIFPHSRLRLPSEFLHLLSNTIQGRSRLFPSRIQGQVNAFDPRFINTLYRKSRQFTSAANSKYFRLRNDLYCVRWGVKLYSLTSTVAVNF